jgi:proteasome-associated ATPase
VGPSGCGKTLLARAVATSVGADKGGFLTIKGPEVLDPYVGVTEQTIRAIFKQAKEYKLAHNREAVIFVDEAESLLAKRGAWGNYMGQTVVPTFLTEMDGLEESCALVILATNRSDTLDPAVIRDGRIDHKIEVGRPTEEEAANIFEIYLNPMPVKTSMSVKQLAEQAAEVLYSVHNQHLPHSGAMIAGIVDKASSFAIRRSIEQRKRDGAICQDDLFKAIEQVRHQENAVKQETLQ